MMKLLQKQVLLVAVLVIMLSVSNNVWAQEEAVHEEEQVQAAPEETVQQEEPPTVEEETKDLYELDIYECVAPQGDPSPLAHQPKTIRGIVTLCFKPVHEDSATLKSINSMEYNVEGSAKSNAQVAVVYGDAADETTQSVCPIENSKLCVTATKLKDSFFEDSNTVQATGKVAVEVEGQRKNVPFSYEFKTVKAPPGAFQAGKIEHEFFDFPERPPPFPMSNQIRLWLLGALILTLLEFAFTPSKDVATSNSGTSSTSNKNGEKNKKPKKE